MFTKSPTATCGVAPTGSIREIVAELRGAPFAWGSVDCACVVFRLVDASVDAGLYARIAGRYATRSAALRVQREVDPLKLLEEIGYRPASYPARSGDILRGLTGGFVSLAFCWRGKIYSAAPGVGFLEIPLPRVDMLAWGWQLCRR